MKPNSFLAKLINTVQRRGFIPIVLGQVGKELIYLIQTQRFTASLPHILIAGGFHGDESAGPLAILQFLRSASDSYLIKTNLFFLPCVNPVGFRNNTRHAIEGIKTNAGFCHPENGDQLSFEGKILMKHKDLLLLSSADGFLSLHEDVEVDKFYAMSFGISKRPDKFARAMRDEGLKHFPVIPNGTAVNFKGEPEVKVMDGFVHNLHDSSFEDFLYHEGTLHSITTETPAKNISLEKRVEANISLIKKFISLSLKELN